MDDLVRSNMLALLEKAEAGLEALPPFEIIDRGAAHLAAVASLVRELKAAGARVDDRPAWENARIKYGGVQSTSTMGTAGAIRNWCVAVRKRLELPVHA